jgi:hypothetical protein
MKIKKAYISIIFLTFFTLISFVKLKTSENFKESMLYGEGHNNYWSNCNENVWCHSYETCCLLTSGDFQCCPYKFGTCCKSSDFCCP